MPTEVLFCLLSSSILVAGPTQSSSLQFFAIEACPPLRSSSLALGFSSSRYRNVPPICRQHRTSSDGLDYLGSASQRLFAIPMVCVPKLHVEYVGLATEFSAQGVQHTYAFVVGQGFALVRSSALSPYLLNGVATMYICTWFFIHHFWFSQ